MIRNSELILSENNSIYHLDLKPEELSEYIILVGDQHRVDKVAAHFDEILLTRQKREFRTITGIYHGMKLSVISTGIGTDNIDIVLTEIDALFNIDFESRTPKETFTKLNFLRLGTCGGLQADMPVGSMVFSSYSIGIDPLLHFYSRPQDEDLTNLEASAANALGRLYQDLTICNQGWNNVLCFSCRRTP